MSFNGLKVEAAQKIVTIIDIELDRCRHTTAQSVTDGAITISSALAIGATTALAISGGNALSFVNSESYLLWDDEIIKVTVDSNIQLTVVSRGHFGTADVAHTAGSATVKHSGEVDGTCYATPFTCSSPDSYEADTKLLFRFPSTQLDVSEQFYVGYSSWSHRPGSVDPGQSMGILAGASFVIKDSVDNDTYVPYQGRRTSNATLLTKILARHPNIEGRPVKIHEGFDPLNLDFNNFITREYIIDSAKLAGGLFSVSVLDPLSLTDEKKAKAPLASLGTNTIAITNASTTITYAGTDAFDYGAATSTAFVRIDSEVIEVTVLSDFVLTIVNRAAGGTLQKDHDINATIQECLVFAGTNVVEIIEDLLTDFTNIPATFLDDYTAIKAATASITLTANINKPTSVRKLIDELIKTGDLVVFYDELTQKIKIKQVTDPSIEPININEADHIGQGSINFTRDTKSQSTRYSVAWAPNDVTKIKDEEFFSIIFQSINLSNELPGSIGEVNEKPIFFNRWLTTSSSDVIKGTSIAQRVIDRNQDVPEIAEFDLDIESVYSTQGGNLELGSIINLSSSRVVEVDGTPKARNHQVLSIKDLGNMRYRIKSRLFQDPIAGLTIDFTVTGNKENYDLSTEFAPVAGNYTVLIDTGVSIGGTSPLISAFTTGAQAAGVTFDFIVRGSIEGAGANGGDGGNLFLPFASTEFSVGASGDTGGTAFEATVDCTINTGSGALWAGGGGAAGGTSFSEQPKPSDLSIVVGSAGNGGSGGQGYVGGGVGAAGSITGYIVESALSGNSGSRGAPGELGGVSGGEFGHDGDIDFATVGSADGGLSGLAIKTNGNNVIITSGNNPLNIRGRIV